MCGIFLSVDLPAAQDAITAVSHRGPDALSWSDMELGSHKLHLGHARLKILDLSEEANQPFYDQSRANILLFNGAIYNYIELRHDLEALGYEFKTRSDTEVLLCALKQWGVEALPRLSGMFAFVWINSAERRIFVARDRFGIKPLYFTQTNKGAAFASEIKQLLSLNLRPRALNLEAAFDFLSGGISDHLPETFFKGVFALRGGEYIDMNLAGVESTAPLSVQTWWRLAAKSEAKPRALAKEAATFREAFGRSLKLHMRSDVPVGACLSGGLDSSSIVAGVDQTLADEDGKLSTFTAEFAGESVDESRFASAVGEACDNTLYHPVRPQAGDLAETIETILHHQDEPFGSSSLYAQWSVFKSARESGMTVMLDGQGADELLAGYHPGYVYHMIDLLRRGRWIKLRRTVKAYGEAQSIDTAPLLREAVIKAIQSSAVLGPLLKIWRRLRGAKPVQATHWLSGQAFAPLFESGRWDVIKACAVRENMPVPTDLDGLCRLMTRSISLPSLLRFEDRNAMAHSLESRVPFLDPDFAEFCLGLGDHYKIDGAETKQILRRGVGDWLPDVIKNRQDKIGFATPEANWFTGALKDEVVAGAISCVDSFPAFFDGPQTTTWINDVGAGRLPYNTRLWRIYIFGRWIRQFDVEI